jgi:hypothetical protein
MCVPLVSKLVVNFVLRNAVLEGYLEGVPTTLEETLYGGWVWGHGLTPGSVLAQTAS